MVCHQSSLGQVGICYRTKEKWEQLRRFEWRISGPGTVSVKAQNHRRGRTIPSIGIQLTWLAGEMVRFGWKLWKPGWRTLCALCYSDLSVSPKSSHVGSLVTSVAMLRAGRTINRGDLVGVYWDHCSQKLVQSPSHSGFPSHHVIAPDTCVLIVMAYVTNTVRIPVIIARIATIL